MSQRPTDAADVEDEAVAQLHVANAGLAEQASDTTLTRRSFAQLAANQRGSTREYLEDGEPDDAV